MTTIDNRTSATAGAEKLLTVERPVRVPRRVQGLIYNEVRHGWLHASRIARQLRFRLTDVDAFVDANAVIDPDL